MTVLDAAPTRGITPAELTRGVDGVDLQDVLRAGRRLAARERIALVREGRRLDPAAAASADRRVSFVLAEERAS